jgi:hypothetical protein
LLLNDRAEFALARQIRTAEGAALGEVFSFLSGLYFRGKLTYARAFARPPQAPADNRSAGIWIITTSRGLLPPETRVGIGDLEEFASVPIDLTDQRYREPLARDSLRVAEQLGEGGRAVLLGSIATGKYVEVLDASLGSQLHFPNEFVGRGDMSRGGLLLRAVDAGQELEYSPLVGAVRRGVRPPKLPGRA